MARRYFGTDGVRGIVGEFLTTELVERLGRASTLWSGRGRVFVAVDSYLEPVTDRFGYDLAGRRIAVDCANGAYSGSAPQAFAALGAEVTAIADQPDGTNINVGSGATDLAFLQRTVLDGGFD